MSPERDRIKKIEKPRLNEKPLICINLHTASLRVRCLILGDIAATNTLFDKYVMH